MRIDPSVVHQIEQDDQEFQQQDPEAQAAVQQIRQQRIQQSMGAMPEQSMNGNREEVTA
jgi:hypothetical protein